MNGELVAEFSCTRVAVEKTGFKREGIKDCCNGRQPSAYGYFWSYEPVFLINTIKAHCKHCGNEFIKIGNHNKIFCSHQCWYENFYPQTLLNKKIKLLNEN
jgi:hypothetical protein